jgi:hypothetical protein
VARTLPSPAKIGTAGDEGDGSTQYAPNPLQLAREGCIILAKVLSILALHAPLYRSKGINLVATDANQCIAVFCDIFHAIKHDTEHKAGGIEHTYARDVSNKKFLGYNRRPYYSSSRLTRCPKGSPSTRPRSPCGPVSTCVTFAVKDRADHRKTPCEM